MISIENHDTDFVIELDLGNTCNYQCNYCFPGANEGTVRWPNIDQLETALLKYIKQHDRSTRLYLIGGEPTLWKHLPRLCNTLKMAHDVKICLSTNASQSLGWWRRHWHCFDVVHISLHHESGDPAHCRSVAELLYDYRVETNIDVLMDPLHFGHCKRLVDAVTGGWKPFPVLAKTVLYDGKHRYNEEQLEYVRDPIKQYPDEDWYREVQRKPRTEFSIDGETHTDDNYFMVNNLNHFEGWQCNLGVDIVKIDRQGNVGGNCGTDLGYNIYDLPDIEIKPVKCSKYICPCSGETITTKWRAHV